MNKLVLLQYDSLDFFVDLCVEISVSVLQWLALGSPLSVMPIQIARHYFIQYILFTNDYIVQNKSLGSVHISWNSPTSLGILNLKVMKV